MAVGISHADFTPKIYMSVVWRWVSSREKDKELASSDFLDGVVGVCFAKCIPS